MEKKAGYVSLLTSNIVFYGYASIEFLVFLILVSLVNYLLIKTIIKYKNKVVLILSLIMNIGILGVLKYYNFFF